MARGHRTAHRTRPSSLPRPRPAVSEVGLRAPSCASAKQFRGARRDTVCSAARDRARCVRDGNQRRGRGRSRAESGMDELPSAAPLSSLRRRRRCAEDLTGLPPTYIAVAQFDPCETRASLMRIAWLRPAFPWNFTSTLLLFTARTSATRPRSAAGCAPTRPRRCVAACASAEEHRAAGHDQYASFKAHLCSMPASAAHRPSRGRVARPWDIRWRTGRGIGSFCKVTAVSTDELIARAQAVHGRPPCPRAQCRPGSRVARQTARPESPVTRRDPLRQRPLLVGGVGAVVEDQLRS